jgi:chemotaxis protein methyltransferase CheR
MSDGCDLSLEDIEVLVLLEAIYHRYHFDFRSYAPTSIRRRTELAMKALRCETISRLQELTLRDVAAFEILLRYLTVQVTDMFRDPGFFRRFRCDVVPLLGTYPSIRIWVAGCSTGEEVYSYAVIMREAGLLDRTIIYATDISASALSQAERGVYPLARMRDFAKNHQLTGATRSLGDHYSAGPCGAVFHRELIKRVVFADHSLATDHVFAEVQVVSCRNVLIYFNHLLQERVVSILTDALAHRGFLGLGSKESLQFSPHEKRFEQPFTGERWYRKL